MMVAAPARLGPVQAVAVGIGGGHGAVGPGHGHNAAEEEGDGDDAAGGQGQQQQERVSIAGKQPRRQCGKHEGAQAESGERDGRGGAAMRRPVEGRYRLFCPSASCFSRSGEGCTHPSSTLRRTSSSCRFRSRWRRSRGRERPESPRRPPWLWSRHQHYHQRRQSQETPTKMNWIVTKKQTGGADQQRWPGTLIVDQHAAGDSCTYRTRSQSVGKPQDSISRSRPHRSGTFLQQQLTLAHAVLRWASSRAANALSPKFPNVPCASPKQRISSYRNDSSNTETTHNQVGLGRR